MYIDIPNGSVEYFNNRISKYSMSKCETLGGFLAAEIVHCTHYYIHVSSGGKWGLYHSHQGYVIP